MKIKFYTLFILLFCFSKGFGAITIKILSPTANATVPSYMHVALTVTSPYDIQSVNAIVEGDTTNLPYNDTTARFTGVVDISALPGGNFTLKIIVTDVLGNVDSTTRVLNHNQAFAPVHGDIVSPAVNSIDTSDILNIYVKTAQVGYYRPVACRASVNGREVDLTDLYPSTRAYKGQISLTGLPQQSLVLFIYTTDNYGNIDTSSVTFIYNKPPRAKIINNWGPASSPLVNKPFLSLKAACLSDSGHCLVQVLSPVDNSVIAQANNLVDTVIDVSGFARLGDSGNIIRVSVIDRQGLKDTATLRYIFEPSPYLTQYDLPLSIPGTRVSIRDSIYNTYFHKGLIVTTPDRSYFIDSINYDSSKRPVYIKNDDYLVWQGPGYFYRQNTHSYVTDSFPGTITAHPYHIVIDTAGNFATYFNGNIYRNNSGGISQLTEGDSAAYVLTVKGDKVLYETVSTQLRLNKAGVDTLVDNNYYLIFEDYAVITGDYIAYYKKGTLGQVTIWLNDSAFHKTRKTFASSNTFIKALTADGNIVYRQLSPDGDLLYFIPRKDTARLIAHIGEYYTVNNQPYIINKFAGSFSLNFYPGTGKINEIKREVLKDSAYAFSAKDFDNAYNGPGYVFKVKITALPKHGQLFLDGKAIKVDTVMAHAFIKNVVYKPVKGYSGKDTINWTAYDGAGFIANDTIIQLTVVTALPVKLLNFSGKAVGKANQLKWQTAQEINSSYFGVEKSTDGQHFSSVGTVAAKGNSSLTQNYEYPDAMPQAGLNHYRLKIVDKDGSYGYSQTISIRNTGSYITLAYPNPAKSFVNLSFTAAHAGRYSFTVYSANGKAVSTNRYTVNSGSQNITLPLSNITGGTYIIRVVDAEGNAITEQKIMKQ